ncbi:hypothetical protein G6F22_019643 [Rhizopus arrhizus]|nr:hypothetical protein G6F22_019643 [Rhizopus arrhizus]
MPHPFSALGAAHTLISLVPATIGLYNLSGRAARGRAHLVRPIQLWRVQRRACAGHSGAPLGRGRAACTAAAMAVPGASLSVAAGLFLQLLPDVGTRDCRDPHAPAGVSSACRGAAIPPGARRSGHVVRAVPGGLCGAVAVDPFATARPEGPGAAFVAALAS